MTDPTYTALLLIIDRSGSMQAIRDDMVGGLESLLAQQAALPGRLTVDIVAFDDDVEHQATFADPASVRVQLEPRGMTALLDALGDSLEGFRSALSAMPVHAQPATVQVVVVTDGHENASTRWTGERVNRLITGLTDELGWDFVFLAAGQDAIAVGRDLGFDPASSMAWDVDADAVQASSASLGRYLTDVRAGSKKEFDRSERVMAAPSRGAADADRLEDEK
ncbi:VWA domain-containing protein [Microcella sp.]|uniref:VWA domain-containing protein n=1 Tax=Microcella sp. TaxID=1913979 RepID=UPI003F6F7068